MDASVTYHNQHVVLTFLADAGELDELCAEFSVWMMYAVWRQHGHVTSIIYSKSLSMPCFKLVWQRAHL